MKPFHLSVADVRGQAQNAEYPNRVTIATLEDLLKAEQFDHISPLMKNSHRASGNFEEADAIQVDLDNTHSNDPGDWKTLDDVQEAFPGVRFLAVRSRNYMKVKRKTNRKTGEITSEEPREKFHLYFPLSRTITDEGEYYRLIKTVLGLFMLFDGAAIDPPHFFFGVAAPRGEERQGEITVDQLIEQAGPEKLRETIRANLEYFIQQYGIANESSNKAVKAVRDLLGLDPQKEPEAADDDGIDWIGRAEQDRSLQWFRSWADQHSVPLGKEYRLSSTHQAHPNGIAICVICPWEDEHSMNGAENETVVIIDQGGKLSFLCRHGHNHSWKEYREKVEAEYAKEHPQEAADPAKLPGKVRELRKLKKAKDLLLKDIPPLNVLVGTEENTFLAEGSCILSSKPKLGKSYLVLRLCYCVATGQEFLGYPTKQCSVLYLDLETGENIQQKRLRKLLKDGLGIEDFPENFYVDSTTDQIGAGFIEQIEAYMAEDPQIGLVVVDVFQKVRTEAKTIKESDYSHAYRDITPINALADKYHISIILVSHDRKSIDADDPFSNILGSVGLQGAATQMIAMFKRKRSDKVVHLSVTGKTLDGAPELDIMPDNGDWRLVNSNSSGDREKEEARAEYKKSNIRRAVLSLLDKKGGFWRGKCQRLIKDAVELCNIPVVESPKIVGGFLHKFQVMFLAEDSVKVEIIDNGTGSKIYKLKHSTVDTIDEEELEPPEEWLSIDK